MNATTELALSALLWLLALGLLHKKCGTRFHAALIAVLSFTLLGLSGVYVVADMFSGAGIDESVVYHLRYGMEGAGFSEYSGVLVGSVVYLGLSALVSLAIFFMLSSSAKQAVEAQGTLRRSSIGAVLILVFAGVINPATHDLYAFVRQPQQNTQADASALYIRPQPGQRPAQGQKPKNLVFIYLESVERSYFDEETFPGLMPRLSVLARESLDFSNISQVDAT